MHPNDSDTQQRPSAFSAASISHHMDDSGLVGIARFAQTDVPDDSPAAEGLRTRTPREDMLDVWDEKPAAAPERIEQVRLGQSVTLLVPFTSAMS